MNQNELFNDLVVVELASALAGPAAGLFFAELGAEVIKIENKRTGGDVTRKWKHAREDKEHPYSAYYFSINWGKQSFLKDLRSPIDKGFVDDLIRKADIVICNYRPGSAARLGYDYQSIKKLNPQIIYANVTAYGDDDTRSGFDAAVQAETGWMAMNGEREGRPTKIPLAIVDLLTGHQLKQGILVALLKRMKTGEGSRVSVSLFDASLATMTNQAATVLNLGIAPQRMGSRHPSIAPYGDIMSSKDGKQYLLAVGTETHFKRLCEVIQSPLDQDKRFEDNHRRLEHRDKLVALLQEKVGQIMGDDFEKACFTNQIPIGAIKNLAEVLKSSEALDLIIEQQYEGDVTGRCLKTVVFRIS